MQRCFARGIHLWVSAIICNAAFTLMGAGPRQFILFNLLTLLALSAKFFQDISRAESIPSRGSSSPAMGSWRPLVLYLMDLLLACYAMTVFIDNLVTAPTLVGTLR